MLANLLPGLREARTPLVAGYLYLALLWLWFGDYVVPSIGDPGVPGRVASLAASIGAPATFAALSLAGFLIGSLASVPRWPWGIEVTETVDVSDDMTFVRDWAIGLNEWTQQVARRLDMRVNYGQVLDERSISGAFKRSIERQWLEHRRGRATRGASLRADLTNSEDEDITTEGERIWLRQAVEEYSDVPSDAAEWVQAFDFSADPAYATTGFEWVANVDENNPWWQVESVREVAVPGEFIKNALLVTLDAEVDHVSGRLLVENDRLFNKYDRMRSEAELRYSVALPLIAIGASLVYLLGSLWPLVAVAAAVALTLQARRTERSSIGVVVDALRYDLVESPTAQTLSRLADQPANKWPPRRNAQGEVRE